MSKTQLNLYIDTEIVRVARDSGLDISAFVEKQLADHAKTTGEQRWLEEHREAIEACNERIRRDGPLNQDLTRI